MTHMRGTEEDCPLVSIIVPCRNESRYVLTFLQCVQRLQYPGDRIEILIADGMSTDGTRQILSDFACVDSRIRVLDNPSRTTPAGLNLALGAVRGDVVVRMDVHAIYSSDYLSTCVQALRTSGAANVGTICETVPSDPSLKAVGIAAAMSTPFGVGLSRFRIGTNHARWVDTVPFGCFPQEIFRLIGGFDEDLLRNQDDAFNGKILRAGYRILLLPGPAVKYRGRARLHELWRMFYQYGLYKPLATIRVGRLISIRQLAPALLMLMLLGSSTLSLLSSSQWALRCLASIICAYGFIALVASGTLISRIGVRASAWAFCGFVTMHFGYGFGWINGVLALPALARRRVTDLPLSR